MTLAVERAAAERAHPFVKWAGGKRALVPAIARLVPQRRIRTYWEPFLGGGAVFFGLADRIAAARLSDVNLDLVITYRVIRNQLDELVDALRDHSGKHGREHYYAVRNRRNIRDPVAVAARFIYLNKTCYNGLYRMAPGSAGLPFASI